tara:strand:+ start:528 stop:1223 length:696 start_codon:yes stop_codon:yes gene_type:complete
MENLFKTNIPKYVTEEGDNILYPFSPPIFQTMVDLNFTKDLITEGRKLTVKDDDHNFNLAGNLKTGRSYRYKDEFVDKAQLYLLQYIERFFIGLEKQFEEPTNNMVTKLLDVYRGRGKTEPGKLLLDTMWINFSQKHDYNPPHTHSGALSFVIFCKVPQEIFNVNADSNSQNSGKLIFKYGEQISKLHGAEYPIIPFDNLMFIFPAELSHFVPAYWVDAERISVSGNFVVV